MPQGRLAISRDYESHLARLDESFLLVLGYCADLSAPSKQTAEIAADMLKAAVQHGVTELLRESDHLLGRFTVICCVNEAWLAFNDAGATRSTYYAEDAPVLASHSTIIGDLFDRPARVRLFRHYKYGLPGNMSPVARVRVLPANFAIDISNQKVFRFWPRTERVERPAAELIDAVEACLVASADAIARRGSTALSLTAGLDSRVSLAAFRHVANKVAFTYERDYRDVVDGKVARKICKALGTPHLTIDVGRYSQDTTTHMRVAAMVDYTHIRALPAAYVGCFGGKEFIHLRSNLGEVTRAFWQQHPARKPRRFEADEWHVAITRPAGEKASDREEAESYARAEMRQFFELAGYSSLDPQQPAILGYDGWDLAYWEHRMSTWHAQVLMGSDFAFDTAILFNSRKLLTLLLSASLEDRSRATLFRTFLARRCPEIQKIPINPVSRFNRQRSLIRARKIAIRLVAPVRGIAAAAIKWRRR